MLIAILLVTIILITFFAKPLNVNNFRMAVGGIYGILFLVVWPYFKYFGKITSLEEQTISICFVLFAVFAGGLVFIPVISKIGKVGAVSLLAMFIITITISFAYENRIKNTIGKLSGYYSDENPIAENTLNRSTVKFTNSNGGYIVELPATWQQRKLQPTGLPFYILEENGTKIAEFRPKCFHQLDVVLPEMVQGLIERSKSNGASEVMKNCYIWRENYNACLVRSVGNMSQQVKSRWQWFGVSYARQQGIELDFVLFENTDSVIQDINFIMDSLEPMSLPTPRPICLGVAQWF